MSKTISFFGFLKKLFIYCFLFFSIFFSNTSFLYAEGVDYSQYDYAGGSGGNSTSCEHSIFGMVVFYFHPDRDVIFDTFKSKISPANNPDYTLKLNVYEWTDPYPVDLKDAKLLGSSNELYTENDFNFSTPTVFTFDQPIHLSADHFYFFAFEHPSCVSGGIVWTFNNTPNAYSIFYNASGRISWGFSGYDANFSLGVSAKNRINPVIIVPGILGSAQKDGVWVIDPIFHVYDNLIETFKINGYKEGENLFTFPYDWRNSNVNTALKLKEKISEVKDVCGCDKVDVVAHSMGGLVSRQYVQSSDYQNDIDQLVFLGTPHLGAPKSYLTWEGGEGTKDAGDKFIRFLLTKEAKKNGYASLFDYILERPIYSIKELLPVFDYLKDKDSDLMRIYPEGYPANPFLESLTQNVSSLTGSGVDIVNIVGNIGTTTVSQIRVVSTSTLPLWEHGYPDDFNVNSSSDHGLILGIGDGTVPLISSSYIQNGIQIMESEHVQLPTQAGSAIYQILTGVSPSDVVDGYHIPNVVLIIKILSPADIVVVSPDGRRVGKDFATGQEFSEIPGAFYSGFGTDDEYITIPDPLDGDYKVEVKGTGDGGGYELVTGLFGDESYSEKEFKAEILPNMVTPVVVTVDTSKLEIEDLSPEDKVSPEIKIISPQSKDYLRSDVLNIEVSASDIDSGIMFLDVFFDGVQVLNNSEEDLFFRGLGLHSVSASSSDYVGNASSTVVNFRLIATDQSLIKDIERSYLLGWINDFKVKESLIKKTKDASVSSGKTRLNILKSIISQLDAQKDKHVNERAYRLLLEDVNWLISN